MKTYPCFQDTVRPLFALVCAVLVTVSNTQAATPAGLDAKTAFARLKSLSGDWTGPKMMGHKLNQNYRVIAGGSAVMETCFPGTPMEMVSLYYLKGDKLVMQHYCMLANQPRMKLNTKKSTADTLVFDFDGGDNIRSTNGHMHSATLHIAGRNKIELTGSLREKGKPDSSCSNTLVRK
jgi:hypothetical protein